MTNETVTVPNTHGAHAATAHRNVPVSAVFGISGPRRAATPSEGNWVSGVDHMTGVAAASTHRHTR